MDRTTRTTGPQGGGESAAQHRYHRVKVKALSCQCSRMSDHQCMMSYAQGSSAGTTSTSVPECTVERTVTQVAAQRGREPQAQQDHNNHRVHRGTRGEEAESHGHDHENPEAPPSIGARGGGWGRGWGRWGWGRGVGAGGVYVPMLGNTQPLNLIKPQNCAFLSPIHPFKGTPDFGKPRNPC